MGEVSIGSSVCSSGWGEGDLVGGTLVESSMLLITGSGEVQVDEGRSGPGRTGSTELELELVAVVSYCTLPGTKAGVSFTWQVSRAAATLAAAALW